jgi:hypothetical protein
MKNNLHSKFGTICQLIESGQVQDAEAEWDTILAEDSNILSNAHDSGSQSDDLEE